MSVDHGFFATAAHFVTIHDLGDTERYFSAEKLPQDIARICGTLEERITSGKECVIAGKRVQVLESVDHVFSRPSDRDKLEMQAFFGDNVPFVQVSVLVKQAILNLFGKKPTPEELGELFGLKKMYMVVPYNGRDAAMQKHLVFKADKDRQVLFSTSAVEFVCTYE